MTTSAEWTSLDLDVNGRRLHALERRDSSSTDAVVLLHGAGGNARTWATIVEAFGDRPLLLVDMPGHGASDRPETWDLRRTADGISKAVRRHLGAARLTWGGHSWGGKVAGLIAAADASQCSGLLLFDPSPSAAVPVDAQEFVRDIWDVELMAYPSADQAVEAAKALEHWQPWTSETEAIVRHGLRRRDDGTWSLSPSRDDLVAIATATLHVDEGETLASASALPTLLLTAEESRPWQAITNVLAYPSATQIEIAGNHWIHQCNPGQVQQAVSAWLNRGST